MSDPEQDEAILRLVKQRGEAKKRKALLENELRTAGRSLWEIGGALRNVKGESFPIQDEPEGGGSFQHKMSLERVAC
jgi:hypothetical protein